MWKETYLPFFSLFISFFILVITGVENSQKQSVNVLHSNSSIKSIFIFGDSSVDSGNNNNLITFYKSNQHPYGVDFPQQTPTGRFSNGRITTDFIGNSIFFRTPFDLIYYCLLVHL